MTTIPTRSQLDEAIKVLSEGRESHGLYALEDANDIVDRLARYHWRQQLFFLLLAFVGAALARGAASHWPLFISTLAGAAIGACAAALLGRTLLVGALLAPRGFTVDDVFRAFICRWRPS